MELLGGMGLSVGWLSQGDMSTAATSFAYPPPPHSGPPLAVFQHASTCAGNQTFAGHTNGAKSCTWIFARIVRLRPPAHVLF